MREAEQWIFLTEGNEGNKGERIRLRPEFECEWKEQGALPLVLVIARHRG